jgi:hypothetical protein
VIQNLLENGILNLNPRISTVITETPLHPLTTHVIFGIPYLWMQGIVENVVKCLQNTRVPYII